MSNMLSAMRVKHTEVEWLLYCIGISSLLLLADILYCSIRWIRYTTVIQDPDVLPVVKQCSYLCREGYIFIYIYFFLLVTRLLVMSINLSPKKFMTSFRLPPLCKSGLRSPGILCSVLWLLDP